MKAQTNQDAANHTPTPWDIFPDYEHAALTIGHYGKSAPLVTHVCDLPNMHGSQANAEFIVRAVNSHAALVAALEKVALFGENPTALAIGHTAALMELGRNARSALTLARGNQ
jgi:hypothetical protein